MEKRTADIQNHAETEQRKEAFQHEMTEVYLMLKEEYENLELKNQAIAEKIAEENLEISEIPDIRSDHFPSPVLNQKLPDCLEHAGGFILRAADTAGDENLPREPLPGSAPPQKISVPLSGGTEARTGDTTPVRVHAEGIKVPNAVEIGFETEIGGGVTPHTVETSSLPEVRMGVMAPGGTGISAEDKITFPTENASVAFRTDPVGNAGLSVPSAKGWNADASVPNVRIGEMPAFETKIPALSIEGRIGSMSLPDIMKEQMMISETGIHVNGNFELPTEISDTVFRADSAEKGENVVPSAEGRIGNTLLPDIKIETATSDAFEVSPDDVAALQAEISQIGTAFSTPVTHSPVVANDPIPALNADIPERPVMKDMAPVSGVRLTDELRQVFHLTYEEDAARVFALLQSVQRPESAAKPTTEPEQGAEPEVGNPFDIDITPPDIDKFKEEILATLKK